MNTEADMEILKTLGGPVFAKKAVVAITSAIESVRKQAGILYEDVANCDVIGEMCRAKINENIRFLAQGQGQDVTIEKPRKQRYGNVLVTVGSTLLTVGRGYGPNHLVKDSMFRQALTSDPLQMKLNLYGDEEPEFDEAPTALILAWGITVNNGIPSVTRIELQQVIGSPRYVVAKIDLLEARSNVLTINMPYIYDDALDVKPKNKQRMIGNA